MKGIVEDKHWAMLAACVAAVAITIGSTADASYSGMPEIETQHVAEMAQEAQNLPDFADEDVTDDEVVIETTEAAKKAVFEVTEYEQETTEEAQVEEQTEESVVIEQVETEAAAADLETEAYYPIYMVDGELMDEDLYRFAYEELESQGIGWWMPYFCLTAYQESRFNVYDVTDGLDYGLLQYRITFWEERAARYGYPGADVFNAYVQIYIYVRQTAARLASGCSVSETISRHYTSDHGSYNQEYVDQVMSHSIEQIH